MNIYFTYNKYSCASGVVTCDYDDDLYDFNSCCVHRPTCALFPLALVPSTGNWIIPCDCFLYPIWCVLCGEGGVNKVLCYPCFSIPPWCRYDMQSCHAHFILYNTQLILADHAEQYSLVYKGCTAVNPGIVLCALRSHQSPRVIFRSGSFASDFSFVVYRPATREVEFSKVPT